MKKFKKIAALAVATVTLVTTAITACAADSYFNMGEIEATTYLANNTIHYLNLKNGYDKNFITFSSVDKNLMEGNIVFSVDFSNPYATSAKEKYRGLSLLEKADYLDDLYLKDANGKFVAEGKYLLLADYNAPKGHANIMVTPNRMFYDYFDLTRTYYYPNDKTKTDILSLHYKFDDYHVFPSYNIILEEISSSPNRAKFTGEFIQNHFGYYTINARGDLATITQGNLEFKIPSQYRGKSFYVYANGIKVGKVTLEENNSYSYTNYGYIY